MNKQALFFGLYFFEGAPIGLIWWTIPTLLSTYGAGVASVTSLLAIATLPWAGKFLFGPIVDRYLYRNKHYALAIAALQIGIFASLSFLLLLGVETPQLSSLVVALSAFSATQDVVIDAWAIAIVPQEDRGSINGAMQAGMLSGKWIFGPGLLIALAMLDWKMAISALLLLVAISIFYLFLKYFRNDEIVAPIVEELKWQSLSFILTKRFLILTAIALFSAFSLESVASVATPLLVKHGYSPSQVGYLLSGTLFVMLTGSLIGGNLSDRFGAKRVFAFTGILLAPTIVLVGLGDAFLWSSALLGGLYLAYVLIGSFTASSYTFYMDQAHGFMEATKFSFLMAITNLCESSASYVTGQLAESPGSYLRAFVVCAALSVMGLALLKLARGRENFSDSPPVGHSRV